MKKKSLLLTMSILLLLGFFSACSKDDNDDTIIHNFQNVNLPYTPVSYENFPDWLKSIIDNSRGVNMTVIRGIKDGNYTYNVRSDVMNNLIGQFFDQEGHLLNDIVDYESYIYETKEWACIAYYKYY